MVATKPERPVATPDRSGNWDDETDEAGAWRRLSRAEAQALRAGQPPLSPWRVIAVQAACGALAALIGGLVTGRREVGWSLLYGVAVAVVPGVLMARGMTSRLSALSPGAGAVGFMSWEFVKLAVSVAMLILAGHIVRPLVWPALLVGLVVGMKVYWVALLWRGRRKG